MYMHMLILALVSVCCFWKWILGGWSLNILFQIVALFLAGFLTMQLYKKANRTNKASLLASAIFMISITPQGNLPKMYFGLLALFFAFLQFKSSSLKPHIKFFYLIIFMSLHIAKYINVLSFLTYLLPALANLIFCGFVASGIDTVLVPKVELKNELIKKARKLSLFLLPMLYVTLLYFRVENKQLFFFVSKVFNILALALLFMFYLSYLVDKIQDGEPIYLRLFIAAMLESLTVSYLL